ncbi:MAG: septum formation protein Maf [Chitinophagaceae bacterium]|nr:septum formation protein Maf [Chitinophagaceae bacterium]
MTKYLLASQSPRRSQLLQWAEIDFEVVVHSTDESFPSHLEPAEAALYVAGQKALAVQNIHKTEQIIIAADTIVVLDNRLIGKPKNRQEAINILSDLSGRWHQVITGVAIFREPKKISFSNTTDVEFHNLSQQQIEFYVDKYQPFDKAGAYAIQEWIGVVGIKRINGDFYNVMGLPVSQVVQALQQFS